MITRLFKRKNKLENNVLKKETSNEECLKLLEIGRHFDYLTAKEHYVAKSEYRNKVIDYKDIVNYFMVLSSSDMLTSFCERNDINEKIVRDIMHKYEKIESLVDEANEAYIKASLVSEKEYLDIGI